MCAASQTGGSEVYSQTLLKNAIPDSTRLSIDNHTAFTSSLCVNQYSKHSCLPELKHIPIHQPSRMATQALVLATNSALQKHQPSAFQEHSLSLQQQPPAFQQQPSTFQQQLPAPADTRKRSSSSGLKKGLDNLTKCIERKIDQQILQAQTRAYDTSSHPAASANYTTKHVHWEQHSHAA